jgi:hypothetical protein
MKSQNLVGQTFGRLTVLSFIGTFGTRVRGGSHRTYLCRCECGKELPVKSVALTQSWTKSCGCFRRDKMRQRMTGKNNPGWVGGRRLSKEGYVDVWVPELQTYRREHDLVMEQYLGRKLYPKETVHHKHGVKDDNSIEHLELWSSNHPSGQRVEDLKSWAKQILQLYPD